MATLAPCLATLRSEFNALNPDRDKASDGWIGDAAHQENPTSDHNPDASGMVHALDVDETGSWPGGGSMEAFVQFMVAECRKSGTSGLDRGRLKYIIYERRIWEASNGWAQRSYSGSNPHDKHAHFSCEYAPEFENDTRPWGLVEKWGDVSEAEVTSALTKFFVRDTDDGIITSRIGRDALDQSIPSGVTGSKVQAWIVLKELGQQLMQIKSTLNTLAGKDMTDEQAIIAGVLAGIPVDALAQAIVDKMPPGSLTEEQIKQATIDGMTEVLTHGTNATAPAE